MSSRVYSVTEVRVQHLMVIPENPPAISVEVKGYTPTSGWQFPELGPWMYIAEPADGILDLDFIATPPTGFVLQVFTPISVTQAFPIPKWVKGVRVHAATNNMVKMFDAPSDAGGIKLMGDGMPLPWPFPWYAPDTKEI
ncbi:hypothetical protein AB4Z10_13435 [Bosea sp. RAF48]|uniref:hypothetical protein n=1 Tax=Bosea sp. RAF48 TaxID=3237480 RepID=UPI003F8DBE47